MDRCKNFFCRLDCHPTPSPPGPYALAPDDIQEVTLKGTYGHPIWDLGRGVQPWQAPRGIPPVKLTCKSRFSLNCSDIFNNNPSQSPCKYHYFFNSSAMTELISSRMIFGSILCICAVSSTDSKVCPGHEKHPSP